MKSHLHFPHFTWKKTVFFVVGVVVLVLLYEAFISGGTKPAPVPVDSQTSKEAFRKLTPVEQQKVLESLSATGTSKVSDSDWQAFMQKNSVRKTPAPTPTPVPSPSVSPKKK